MPFKNLQDKKHYQAMYYLKHRAKIRRDQYEYYLSNRDRILERDSLYHRENREARNRYARKWRKENPDKSSLGSRIRKKMCNTTRWTKEDRNTWKKILKDSNGICPGYKRNPHYVGIENLQLDHIVPLCLGGKHIVGNIQPLCRSCNSKKRGNLDIGNKRVDPIRL